jgi:hypothetical protein
MRTFFGSEIGKKGSNFRGSGGRYGCNKQVLLAGKGGGIGGKRSLFGGKERSFGGKESGLS